MADVGIENQELVIGHLGHWPAFHDAEVVSLLFERGEPGYWPIITLRLEAKAGYDKAAGTPAKHFLLELQFAEVHDHELNGFNDQNVIFSLDFTREDDLIVCDIEPSYGVSGHIVAERVTVKKMELLDSPQPRP
ncbi:MAG: immunity 50 family protein [Bacteroidota bacterium]|nr:immunity 50 family protein [Bacteroidota bacterium]